MNKIIKLILFFLIFVGINSLIILLITKSPDSQDESLRTQDVQEQIKEKEGHIAEVDNTTEGIVEEKTVPENEIINTPSEEDKRKKEYIAYVQELNKTLNKVDVSFEEIEQYDEDCRQKVIEDKRFREFITTSEKCIPVGKINYEPIFFMKKLDDYYKVAQWVKNGEYDKLDMENKRSPKEAYGKIKHYHVRCLHRISLGVYDSPRYRHMMLCKYDDIERPEARHIYIMLLKKQEITSFKDLEKINVVNN